MSELRDVHERSMWRFGLFMATGWLVFLLFPAWAVLLDDLADWRKVASMVVLVLFSIAYGMGYRGLIRREIGFSATRPEGWSRWLDAEASEPWFALLIALTAVGVAAGEWAMLGVTPFIVSYAVFHFHWTVSAVVAAATTVAVLVAPAIGGVLGDVWFFPVIAASVGGGSAVARVTEERQRERSNFETQLAVGEERQRVARDVHDVLGHSLTAVILKGQVIDRMLARIETDEDAQRTLLEQARQQLTELDQVSRRALAEIRSTVGGLRSADLGDELVAARAVLADAGVALTVTGDQAEVPAAIRPVLGWVVREAVTNVVRHSRADQCEIELGADGDAVFLRVTDDGVGLAENREGNGLSGLRERVEAAGAQLRVEAAAPAGTLVEVRE